MTLCGDLFLRGQPSKGLPPFCIEKGNPCDCCMGFLFVLASCRSLKREESCDPKFLFGRLILFNELRRRETDVLFELAAEKVYVAEAAHLGDLGDGIKLGPQQITGIVELEPDDVFFGWQAVASNEKAFQV